MTGQTMFRNKFVFGQIWDKSRDFIIDYNSLLRVKGKTICATTVK